mgnify:CR=1 FL=1
MKAEQHAGLQPPSRFYIVETRNDVDFNHPSVVETQRSPKEYWAEMVSGFLDVNLWEIACPKGSHGGDFDLELFWDWRYDMLDFPDSPSEQEWTDRPDGVISHWQSTIDFVQRRNSSKVSA